jgi:hypothetical protein
MGEIGCRRHQIFLDEASCIIERLSVKNGMHLSILMGKKSIE